MDNLYTLYIIRATFQAFAVLALLALIIGLIKPKWIVFWSQKPDRLWVMTFSFILFMISFTGIGEFNKRVLLLEQQLGAETVKKIKHPEAASVPDSERPQGPH